MSKVIQVFVWLLGQRTEVENAFKDIEGKVQHMVDEVNKFKTNVIDLYFIISNYPTTSPLQFHSETM